MMKTGPSLVTFLKSFGGRSYHNAPTRCRARCRELVPFPERGFDAFVPGLPIPGKDEGDKLEDPPVF